jgi:hypothetical protein
MAGLSSAIPGVMYRTDLDEPHRSGIREALARMLQALDAPPPPPHPLSSR